jgi:hypothetical protein
MKKITTWSQGIEIQKSWKLIRQTRSRVKATTCVMSRIDVLAVCDRLELKACRRFQDSNVARITILSSKCILMSCGLALTTDTSLMYQLHQRTTCISLLIETCRHKAPNKWWLTFCLHVHFHTILANHKRPEITVLWENLGGLKPVTNAA